MSANDTLNLPYIVFPCQ